MLALELIASLEVVQALGLQLRVEIVLIVVARRLFVGDGIRGIDLVVGRDVVVQAELGVEEVERIVNHVSAIGIGAVPVTRILHLNADMPVLKVEEAVQAVGEVVVHFAIEVPVSLLSIAAIVFKVGQQF